MSPLTINFNQFVDLTINPYHGTINTTLLHTLLHLIIDQLKLSTCLVEFHGNGSALIENQILCNKSHQCGLKVKRYEIKQEIDEGSSECDGECEKFKKQNRIEIEDEMVDNSMKIYAITDIAVTDNRCSHPIGYPLNPIQPISIEDFKQLETKVNSIHDVVASVMPTDSAIIRNTDEKNNTMKQLIDFVNATKRIDALEIAVRQLAGVVKKSHYKIVNSDENVNKVEEKVIEIESYEPEIKESVIQSEKSTIANMESLSILEDKLNKLADIIDNIQCKCSESDYENHLFQRLYEQFVTDFKEQHEVVLNEIENVKAIYHDQFVNLIAEIDDYKKSISENLQKHESNLIKSLREVEDILNTKLDKSDVGELKNFVRSALSSLEEKIANIDCNRALAAGITDRIFKDVTCVSCSEKVIQIDDPLAMKTQKLSKISTKQTTNVDNQHLNLYQLETRLCGGNHTITMPGERIFRSRVENEKKLEK